MKWVLIVASVYMQGTTQKIAVFDDFDACATARNFINSKSSMEAHPQRPEAGRTTEARCFPLRSNVIEEHDPLCREEGYCQ